MHSEYTIILKLIPRASKKVNDAYAVAICGLESIQGCTLRTAYFEVGFAPTMKARFLIEA
jgi:hypothetical protein